MLTKLRTLASLYRELGPRWSAFRLAYAFRLRSGLIRLQMPQYNWETRPLETWLKKDIPSTPESYFHWRKNNSSKFFFDENVGTRSSRPGQEDLAPTRYGKISIDEADRILKGEIKYFAHQFHQTGFPPNWHSAPGGVPAAVPQGGFAQDDGLSNIANKHWSQISDDGAVDIKFIWEPNRFAFVYTLVRAYASIGDEKYAQAFWTLIEDWAKHNSPNSGANWKDGQEISLRLMAWMFGYYQFSNSPSATPQRIADFTTFVAAQAERIYKNIDYAISTRSNHTISEAFGLWLVGLLFPELKDSEKYFSLGKKILEEEATKQFFPDGSYSMYSINYHRFVLHIYLYAIRLGEINNLQFSKTVYSSIFNSITYLLKLIDPNTGQIPFYGSNDGALVLPINNCDFTDFRPLLQLGGVIIHEEQIFELGIWDEDLFWFFPKEYTAMSAAIEADPKNNQIESFYPTLSFLFRENSFPNGGIYLLRNTNSKAIIRCTDFKSRPSHADQLHVDLWMHGHNIACDAGTYLYSGEGIWRNGLAQTSAHNTVTVDNKDQMTMVSRFTWTNWSKGKVLQHNEKLWQGEHDSYKPVSHKRTVLSLEGDRWLVIDNLDAKESHHYALHWLLSDGEYGVQELSAPKGYAPAYGLLLTPINLNSKLFDSKINIQIGLTEGNGKFSIIRADPNSTHGWRSRYYAHKEPAISLLLEANQAQVTFWSFFGFENDEVKSDGKILQIKSTTFETTLDLTQ